MSGATLLSLPDEVIGFILQHLDPTSILVATKVSRRLRDLANEPRLWRNLCRSSYKYWDEDVKSRLLNSERRHSNWKAVFQARSQRSRRTLQTLQAVIDNPIGRIDRINEIVVDIDYGVKNELLKAFEDAPRSPNHLAQKYDEVCTL